MQNTMKEKQKNNPHRPEGKDLQAYERMRIQTSHDLYDLKSRIGLAEKGKELDTALKADEQQERNKIQEQVHHIRVASARDLHLKLAQNGIKVEDSPSGNNFPDYAEHLKWVEDSHYGIILNGLPCLVHIDTYWGYRDLYGDTITAGKVSSIRITPLFDGHGYGSITVPFHWPPGDTRILTQALEEAKVRLIPQTVAFFSALKKFSEDPEKNSEILEPYSDKMPPSFVKEEQKKEEEKKRAASRDAAVNEAIARGSNLPNNPLSTNERDEALAVTDFRNSVATFVASLGRRGLIVDELTSNSQEKNERLFQVTKDDRECLVKIRLADQKAIAVYVLPADKAVLPSKLIISRVSALEDPSLWGKLDEIFK